MQGELEHIPEELERPITKWEKAICPICGKEYIHSRFYHPKTCLSLKCILKERGEENDETNQSN